MTASELAGDGTLWEPLGERRNGGPVLSVWEQGWQHWTWDDWLREAGRFAGGLRAAGVRPGERVGCVLENSLAACAAVLGTWQAGACLVSLPAPARGVMLDQYVRQVGRMVAHAGADVVVVPADFAGPLAAACPRATVGAFQDLRGPAINEVTPPATGDPVFIQYSSGSTSDPHGCVLSGTAIARQLAMLTAALELDSEQDVKVDWLPLSHDMGLFGCLLLTAYWTGTRQVLSTPQRFLASPQSWFADCGAFGATLACGPNFALELTARVAALVPSRAIPMRRLVVGAERVEPGTLDRVCQALGPTRLRREALLPAYGLAEATLAVTMTPLGAGPTVTAFDRDRLANGLIGGGEDHGERLTYVTSVGPPLPGTEAEIVGDKDVGEIRVRGPSLASGYLDAPRLTAERFTPDGLLTGDVGFSWEGNLFVTGRTDDLLVVGGRNVYARDVEAALVGAGAVRPGNCAVVAVANGPEPRVVAVAEPAERRADLHVLAARMNAAAFAAAGVRLSECVFLPRGRFPKTPSGKAQRFRCLEIASEGAPSVAQRIILRRTGQPVRVAAR